jgi:hypothetical protein
MRARIGSEVAGGPRARYGYERVTSSPQIQLREVCGIVAPISRQQSVCLNEGMCADDEVGDDMLSRPNVRSTLFATGILLGSTLGTHGRRPAADVLAPGPPGAVERLGIRPLQPQASFREKAVKSVLVGKVDGKLGVYRIADDDGTLSQSLSQGLL